MKAGVGKRFGNALKQTHQACGIKFCKQSDKVDGCPWLQLQLLLSPCLDLLMGMRQWIALHVTPCYNVVLKCADNIVVSPCLDLLMGMMKRKRSGQRPTAMAHTTPAMANVSAEQGSRLTMRQMHSTCAQDAAHVSGESFGDKGSAAADSSRWQLQLVMKHQGVLGIKKECT